MTSSGAAIPRRIDTLIIHDDAEVPSLLNPATGQVLIVNEVGKRIMELADGSRTVDAIADTIASQFSQTERHDVKGDVARFLEESTRKGVVSWPTT